ncbi:AI-2E family transporter [Demequina aurantiaca]|uniref:AI-2E family transporter n=1 Tax=Demequina aurantiaca TaxID=676200 RepID=UPI001364CB42|nr:AI-2E family transporter [Demequina aurantiaca]
MTKKPRPSTPYPRSPGQGVSSMPKDVLEEVEAQAEARANRSARRDPAMDRFVWSILGKVVAAAAMVTVACFVIYQTRHLLGLVVISTFFALAMIPGINALVRRWQMSRGAAVGIIYLIAVVVVGLLVGLLIPAVVKFAAAVGANVGVWVTNFNAWTADTFGSPLLDDTSGPSDAVSVTMRAVSEWGDNVLGFISSGLGLVFDLFTIAAFTFYIAADFPKIVRAFMRRMPPERQRLFWWIADQSIEQTGGYFYSRMLLMAVNGSLGFVVLMVLGLPLVYSLPLALFMGFVSEFIPFIGTYIGAALPILILLAVQGPGAALIMTVYIIAYQQAENYWLSPKFSSETMELNGAIAFGGAMAGGAIAGAMGAFMALPIAALITAIIKNTGKTYEVVETEDDEPHLTDGGPLTKEDDDDGDDEPSKVAQASAAVESKLHLKKKPKK